jgi:4-hydroxymandelate oxidase
MPVLVAPMAYQRMIHPDGEVAMAAGTSAVGGGLVLSSMSTTDMEEVAAASSGPVFFQLYVYDDPAIVRELVARVEAAGCQALVLTVDLPVVGNRHRDEVHQFTLREGMSIQCLTAEGPMPMPDEGESGLVTFFRRHLKRDLDWDDVAWLRSITRLPIVLKGVLRADDAARAVDAGASAICVSNHGGRQLDAAPATFDVLPAVVDAVAGRAEVWVDGGIRRGTDIVKAIAAGATCTLIGRPFAWALASDGADGVASAWAILRRELAIDLALCGCAGIDAISRDLLFPPQP